MSLEREPLNLQHLVNHYISYLLCVLLSWTVYSNNPEPVSKDSLQQLYQLSSQAVRDYDYKNSQLYSQQLIELASQSENYYYLYHGYNILGVGYADLKDSVRAKVNYEKALRFALLSENDTILCWAYNNLGNIFSENKKTVEKGLAYYDKAIGLAAALGSKRTLTPIINKGWTHLDNKQYKQAFPYLKKARALLSQYPDEIIKSQLDALFGIFYAGKQDFQKSTEYFQDAIEIAERDTLLLEASMAYGEYADMLFQKEDFHTAYHALRKHQEYQSKIFEDEKLHQMEAAHARFETDEYRKNLELAKQKQVYQDKVIQKSKEITIIMVVSLIIMLVFFVLVFKNNRLRKRLIGQLKEKNAELQASKEEAERLSMLKTRFFSTVSHELRTPLYGVVGLTSLLLEENSNEKQVEDLKSLKFSADYLLALINDVLQMNKMESNLVQLENIPFNIQDLVEGIVKSFEFSRNQNQNVIELYIDPKIPKYLIGDSVRLSQVLMNLVGNAVKFTERDRVWIKAEYKSNEKDSNLIYFEVGDSGIGIPENKQQLIFDEFSQIPSNNYNYQGTGLGLSIVKRLLKLFNAEIKLKSEEGKGAVFSFEIWFEAAKTRKQEENSSAAIASKKAGRKVLIVDDNRINQVVTQRILEKRDFSCQVANDGFQAIEILKRESYDLVLMDVNMPGMSGMETTRKIREFNAIIPILALTAMEIDEMREAILSSGMNDIIIKPYDTHEFFQIIFRNLLVAAG